MKKAGHYLACSITALTLATTPFEKVYSKAVYDDVTQSVKKKAEQPAVDTFLSSASVDSSLNRLSGEKETRYFSPAQHTAQINSSTIQRFSNMVVNPIDLMRIADQRLKVCVEQQVQANGWINTNEVTQLDCSGLGIDTLAGLEQFTELAELNIADNQLVDVYPLSMLFHLVKLNVSGNTRLQFNDITTVIHNNTRLESLWLNDIFIPGQEFPVFFDTILQKPYGFKELSLANTGVNNLHSLSNYQNTLAHLNISHNLLEQIHGVSQLSGLTVLDVSHNPLMDLYELSVPHVNQLVELDISGLTSLQSGQAEIESILMNNGSLEKLWASDSAIIVGPSVNLSQVKSLNLNRINELILPPLNGLHQLEELHVSGNRLENIVGLEQLINLKKLDISENLLEGSIDVHNLTQLTALDIAGNRVDYISGITGLTQLVALNISETGLTDLSMLSPIVTLKAFSASGLNLPASELLAFMQSNPSLTVLDLAGYDLQGLMLNLSHWTDLSVLDISDSNADMPDLNQAPGLTALYAANNHWVQWPQLYSVSNLTELDLSDNNLFGPLPLALDKLKVLKLSNNSNLNFHDIESVIIANSSLEVMALDGIHIGPEFPQYHSPDTYQPLRFKELSLNNTGLEQLSTLELYKETLTTLSVADNQLTQLYGLQDMSRLRALDLSNNDFVTLGELAYFQLNKLEELNLSGLTQLQMPGSALQDIINNNSGLKILNLNDMELSHSSGLSNFANIEVLHLDRTGYSNLTALLDSEALEVLSFSDNGLQQLPPLSNLIRLRELDLSYNPLEHVPLFNVSPLLSRLDVSHTDIEHISGLETLTHLRALNISHTKIFDVISLQNLTQLQQFSAVGLPVNAHDILAVMINNPQLEALELTGYDLRSENLMLDSWPHLKSLDISYTGMSMPALDRVPELETLRAAGNDWYAIADLSQVPDLKVLDLSHNQLTHISHYGTQNLVELNLSGNRLIDSYSVHQLILENPQLEILALDDIHIGPDFHQYTQNNGYGFYGFKALSLKNTGLTQLNSLEVYRETLTQLDVSDNKLVHLDGVNYLTALTALNVSNNPIEYLAGLSSPELKNLLSLDLSGLSRLEPYSVSELADILNNNDSLTALNLNDMALEGSGTTLNFTGIQELYLDRTGYVDLQSLTGNQALTVLSVSDNGITQLPDLNMLYQLRSLDISSNPIQGMIELSALSQLEQLFIQDTQIDYLSGVSSLMHLNVLDVSHTRLFDLHSISSLTGLHEFHATGLTIPVDMLLSVLSNNPQLEELDLEGYDLTGYTLSLYQWQNLRVLNINHTQGYLPDLNQAPQLEALYAAGNGWAHLPDLNVLHQLQVLDVSDNQLMHLPFASIETLEELNVSGNTRLDFYSVDQWIQNNPQLHALGLDGIRVGAGFPSYQTAQGMPYGFETLSLENTGLDSLHSLNIYNHTLKHVNLADNAIANADGIQHLFNLVTLDLSDNPLTNLYQLNDNNISQLIELNLSGLTALDMNAAYDVQGILINNPQLTHLDLSDMDLSSVAGTLNFDRIQVLALDRTGFQNINLLTAAYQLEELSLSDNGIQSLPPLSGLINLRRLNISDNPINTVLDAAVLSKLVQLDISNTDIVHVNGLDMLSELRELNISHSGITDLYSLSGLTQLDVFSATGLSVPANDVVNIMRNNINLTTIDLSGYDLSTQPFDLNTWPELKALNVSNTGIGMLDLAMVQGLEVLRSADNGWDVLPDLNMQTRLKVLDISGNQLTHLSPIYSHSLQELNLSGNANLPFMEIDQVIQLHASLKVLNLNGITGIGSQFPMYWDSATAQPYGFTELHLNETGISTSQVRDYVSLKKLSLAGNGVSETQSLTTLFQLQALDLSNNTLMNLHGLDTLVDMTYLNVKGNGQLACMDLDWLLTVFGTGLTLERPDHCPAP